MALYGSMRELVGDTPLVQLGHLGLPEGVRLFAKLELCNPGGSTKDRIGISMIEDAERSGRLAPGGTIVEATAGNTGLGIAFAALGRGYRVVLVIPTKFSEEKQQLVRALGAQVVNTPREEGMLGAERRADEIVAATPGAVALGQFRNMANPAAHYAGTGPEIYRDLGGRIDYIVAGAGSGGTYSGVVRFCKERDPRITGVLADPVGSTMGGGEHGDYDIEGIGNDFVADTMDMDLVDAVVKMNDPEAFAVTRMLARAEGIVAGSSSGAALAAVFKLVEAGARGDIVTIFPDRGDRYLSEGLFDAPGQAGSLISSGESPYEAFVGRVEDRGFQAVYRKERAAVASRW